jgi:hypothetical protein
MSRKSAYSFFVVSLQRHDKEYEKMNIGGEEHPAYIHFFEIESKGL